MLLLSERDQKISINPCYYLIILVIFIWFSVLPKPGKLKNYTSKVIPKILKNGEENYRIDFSGNANKKVR